MPMYEFFCSNCNTIYTFLSKKINTEKIPSCPKCHNKNLEKMVSRFAFTGSSKKDSGDNDNTPDLPIDESKMEQAIASLASQAENINENDPRQAADLMRRLSSMTGLKLGDKMEEALSRMESGEDPEAIEKDMEDIDENDLFKFESTGGGKKHPRPARDETLYEM
ncbi:MAG: zinc ribbon domain-containing protein [Chitinispirillaceae bacterium]|nr:zinc ribbon domain-containing protein [Chitinispirillaceae bacterium]